MSELQTYALRIDGRLFRRQRQLLVKLLDVVLHDKAYAPAAEDADLLEGIAALLDEIADQAHDRHGIECLLEDHGEEPAHK